MRNDKIAVVLPPRESFSPAAAGAIGLVVQRLAVQSSVFRPVVLGAPVAAPFPGVPFRPVQPPWMLAGSISRYAAGVVRALGGVVPAVVEVHNRPDLALALADLLPAPVLLVLHNNPQGMRRAGSPAERLFLLGALARVATVSGTVRDWLLDGLHEMPRVPEILPNCIDMSAVPPPAPREQVLLFAGRAVADKGADVFVEACARALPELPGWRAELIGADRFGADSPETPFLRALRPAAAAAGVTLRGWLPHARGAGGVVARRHRRGAQPLARAVRPGGAGGDGLRGAAAGRRPWRPDRSDRQRRPGHRPRRSRRPGGGDDSTRP